MFFRPILIIALLATSVSIHAQGQTAYVWWEGEDARETNFPSNTWFGNGAVEGKRHLLSNRAWLCNEGNRTGDEAFAKYEVTVPEDGVYDFWARKFWKHGPFRWRFGDDEWQTVGRDIALADSVSIQQNLGVNWVYAGESTLAKGTTTFELRLLAGPGESLTACFDCFLLTPLPFIPRGALRPDERSNMADEGYFPWEPAIDAYTDEALLDLRSLNETQAGVNGFVKRQGDQFVLGDGTQVRFWAVNGSSGTAALNRKSIDYLAKSLAKRGVNMVRYHSPLFDSENVDHLDQKKLDDLFYFIEALKREGIYTSISFYFPLWFDIKPSYGIEGYDSTNNKRPFALLFFQERMQEIYNNWARELLTTKSPYSGKTLGNEPAVALVEILNEDNLFFWTFTKSNVPSVHWQQLELLFGDWLVKKHGSLNKAYQAWSNQREADDNLDAGRMGIYEAWHMTTDAVRQAGAGKKKRVGDQTQFLTELQRGFFEKTTAYFKNDLGAKNMVYATNWHTADASMTGALERYSYMAGDAIDKHGYFDAGHSSSDGTSSYAVNPGHTFQNHSALLTPESLPIQFIQIENYPHLISEIGWTNPNLYRADYAFLTSAYCALQDVDAIYTFALGGAFWDTSMNKFALSSPVILGNFPAYALLYRRGDVQAAEPVIHQILSLDDLYAMKGNGGAEAQSLDEFRNNDVPPGQSTSGQIEGIDPLSFYVGRVVRTFGDNPEDSREVNLSSYIDRENKTVQSQTGELMWNYGDGLVTIDSPLAQGCTGFLANAGSVQLSKIKIDSQNDYGSIIAISLDGKPLESSEKILIQSMTAERPYGFRVSGDEEGTITDIGGFPFGVKKNQTSVSLSLSNCSQLQVTALDENGYPTNKSVEYQGGTNGEPLTIQLNEDSVYHIIQRTCTQKVGYWKIQN
ncbi:MAG: hypothetical protein P9L94_19775 [Candidatus Hinthialibacter antarcticus]|nr:hypothetical protein [Candidatus Hinthialibacter antarcticus]